MNARQSQGEHSLLSGLHGRGLLFQSGRGYGPLDELLGRFQEDAGRSSIDIADVDVGENIGAKLQAEQAESNKLVAQAQAEVRRAAAVAVEQEMTTRVEEMQAKVVEAEAQVPLAMAEAFRSGNLGIMDYYRMKNLAADTDMRSKIAGSDDSGKPKT
jgi:uncharacterized protein YqfA (UPF0365 family)